VVDAAEADGLEETIPGFIMSTPGTCSPTGCSGSSRASAFPSNSMPWPSAPRITASAPPGFSHLDFRHRMFTAALDHNPVPQALLYRSDQVPAEMNRLSAIANDAKAPCPPIGFT
jgi:hypothetical protein